MGNWFLMAAVLARFLYLGYVGFALRRQEKRPTLTWEQFQGRAALVMNLDTAIFILAVIATGGDIDWLPVNLAFIAGAVLLIVGLGAKYLAFRILGKRAYYWGDFFSPAFGKHAPVKKGIYKYMDNPMYVAGYLNAYGWALLWLSWKGLLLAAFYQAVILAFYYIVERPHFLRVYRVEKTSNEK